MYRYNIKAKIPVNNEQTHKQRRTRRKIGCTKGRAPNREGG
jgi:hypothetical protein